MNAETLKAKLEAAGCISNGEGTLVVDSRKLLLAHVDALGEIERLAANDERWAPIAQAPVRGSFIIAAWDPIHDNWIVGEGERDPDDQDKFWWASQRGDHQCDHLAARGLIALFCMPLPTTATLPNPPALP